MRSLFLAAVIVAAPGAALAQDAAAGEKTFAQCRACHQVGPTAKNAVGPVLNGLFGRKSGSIEGYTYTAANKDSGITWDEATFAEYIKDPKAKIPGTKMVYAGLKDEQRIKDLSPISSSSTPRARRRLCEVQAGPRNLSQFRQRSLPEPLPNLLLSRSPTLLILELLARVRCRASSWRASSSARTGAAPSRR